ncbi:hypothetical protein ABCR94_17040 [Streptomyces sp. 21So2-11]|uniref:hypothetical protein n=1 Tax=Streptomyces sp. 21So2-11 TaxID=3144408 RepID=UPI00321A7F9E
MTSQADEDLYLRKILTLLDRAKPYETITQSHSLGWQVLPGSSLAGDDAKTDPYQLSHSAWNALSVAVDHRHCYRSTLVGDQQGTEISITLHTHAQYSLLRGAFENSARAVWMLGPSQRLERVQRRLSLQAGEHRHSDRMTAHPAGDVEPGANPTRQPDHQPAHTPQHPPHQTKKSPSAD